MILTISFLRITSIIVVSIVSFVKLNSPNSQNAPGGTNENNFSAGDTNHSFDFRDDAAEARRPHYALNPTKTKRLALTEESLITALTDIANKMPFSAEADPCYKYLSKYLSEFQQDTKAVKGQRGVGRAIMVAENPILTLKMIRRIHVTLNSTMAACWEVESYQEVVNAIIDTFTVAELEPPTKEDFDDALTGLLRIQYIYGLNATRDIRVGNLNGRHTGAFLYFDDCLALAQRAMEMSGIGIAYQWLVAAPLSPPEMLSRQEHLNEDMVELENAWLKLLNITKLENDREKMHELLNGKLQWILKDFYLHADYAVCRGETTLSVEEQSTLYCFNQFDSDPYFYINPVKTEVLSREPRILQFYDFVKEETMQLIKLEAAGGMQRSGVVSSNGPRTEFLLSRTSMNSWVYDSETQNPDPKLVTLNKRIEKLIGLEIYKPGASNMQVAMYGALGGHYDFHHDALQQSPAPIHEYGDRIATFLMFLSDVSIGGYTAFPWIGIHAKPIKGSAILWYNLLRNGKDDERTGHGGCPVILGSKEVANRWIMQYENMWKHPCLLDPDK